MGTYVGELQELWQFPSDHLPIGMEMGNSRFASWNVLDAAYMDWVIEKNSQGLSRSLIAEEHVFLENSKLTVRDCHVIDLILQILEHKTSPKHLLSLQECGEAFLIELEKRLPPQFTLIANDGNAILFDNRHFELLDTKAVSGVYSVSPERTFQDAHLKNLTTNETIRILNAHIPGDPTKPARFEFAGYLAKTFDKDHSTIAMGDMNFNEWEMRDAIQKAFQGLELPFSLYSPYCTNISPGPFNSKAIDHFAVHSKDAVRLSSPNDVWEGLEETARLLN
jgi:endonuclease/exonuclease/phosphatase family metal-dependent hydrolase